MLLDAPRISCFFLHRQVRQVMHQDSAIVHVCVCHCCIRTWAPEFILLGGYDQEPGIMPSSQQDEDLKKRVWNAASKLTQIEVHVKPRDIVLREIQLQKTTIFASS